MSLSTVAILKRQPVTPAGDRVADELIYGPVTITGDRCSDTNDIAHRVIAQAAAEGKLPEGWTSAHYVAGLSYSCFT